MRLKFALTALPFLFGCAAPEVLMTDTPSGYPEATFENTTLQDVQNKLIGVCSRIGAAVSDTNANMVVCGKTMEGQSAVFAQLLLGNSYSTTPVDKIRFVLDSNGSTVHVTAYEWVETVMPFGQVKQAELRSNSARNAMQRMLDRLSDNRSYGSSSYLKTNTPVAIGGTIPVTTVCTSYDEAGPGNIVKHYKKGDSLNVYERSSIYVRVSAKSTPPEWIVDGACTR